jgi:hypothetical protein
LHLARLPLLGKPVEVGYAEAQSKPRDAQVKVRFAKQKVVTDDWTTGASCRQ